jgi:hypothetical protein
MRNILILGSAALATLVSIVAAEAANPNVPSWSPYAAMDYGPAPAPLTERRAAAINMVPAPGGGYVDYKSVGLSGNPADCNMGCAVTNN